MLEMASMSGIDGHDGNRKLKELLNIYAEINDVSEDEIIENFADKKRIELMSKKYSSVGFDYDGIKYADYIYNNGGINQIEWATKHLKEKEETKSATIGLHIAGENKLTCLSTIDFKIRDGRVIMNAVYRSQDIFNSLPGNYLALRKIQEHVARETGKATGALNAIIFSAHIYEHNLEKVKSVLADMSRQKQ